MLWRNKALGLPKIAVIGLLVLLTGCAAQPSIDPQVNSKIDVLGIQLNMSEAQLDQLASPKPEKAMCIYGYEYNYTDRKINIGFSARTNKIRRISTKNSDHSILGIVPGISLDDAFRQIGDLGYVNDGTSKYRFIKDNLILSIISMNGVLADGVIIEIKPE